MHWRESNLTLVGKLESLEVDCLSAPYHYFGCHLYCHDYFCKKTTTLESTETISRLKAGGIFHDILNLCNVYFASNVRSLLENRTSNAAEELNNVIAKYLGNAACVLPWWFFCQLVDGWLQAEFSITPKVTLDQSSISITTLSRITTASKLKTHEYDIMPKMKQQGKCSPVKKPQRIDQQKDMAIASFQTCLNVRLKLQKVFCLKRWIGIDWINLKFYQKRMGRNIIGNGLRFGRNSSIAHISVE